MLCFLCLFLLSHFSFSLQIDSRIMASVADKLLLNSVRGMNNHDVGRNYF